MKLSNFKIGIRLSLLAAILLFATLFIGLRGLAINEKSLQQSEQIMQQETQIEQVIDTARDAQVQFKIQVQEWKNILLRGGQDPQIFNKYKTSFIAQSNKTQQLLAKLTDAMPALNMDNRKVKETRQLHAELQQRYLSALEQYRQGDASSAQRVDHLVTGVDRLPTSMIESVQPSTSSSISVILG